MEVDFARTFAHRDLHKRFDLSVFGLWRPCGSSSPTESGFDLCHYSPTETGACLSRSWYVADRFNWSALSLHLLMHALLSVSTNLALLQLHATPNEHEVFLVLSYSFAGWDVKSV